MKKLYIQEAVLRTPLNPSSYLLKIPAVRYLAEMNSIPFDSAVTILVGENGSGKSTLLEGIAVAFGFNPEGGSRNYSFSTNDTHSSLGEKLTLVKAAYPKDGFFLRAESFYNAATYLEQLDAIPAASPTLTPAYGGVSLHQQSHGESFIALVHNRLRGEGLYILDEPEAALSPRRQMQLLVELDRLVKAQSQCIIATHSPIIMAFPGAAILELSEDGIRRVPYKQTEHYSVMRRFLEDPEGMLNRLLNEEDK